MQRYKLGKGVGMEQVDGSCVMTTGCGDVAVLNDTAELILRGVLEGLDAGQMAGTIQGVYDVDARRAMGDAHNLIADLRGKGLLVKSDA
jgi:hypothetical protein